MKSTLEEVVAMLSKPELQDMLSAKGNAVVDVILDALYDKIERGDVEEKTTKPVVNESYGYLPVRSCPICDGSTSVIESRENNDGTIRRRRVCQDCGHRFSTMEIFYNYKKKSTNEV